MQSDTIICKKCGAVCSANDIHCRNCSASLIKMGISANDESLKLHGIPLEEWRKRIEKNADRYLNIFRKNENKPFFFHFNLAASFFDLYWFFYRGMYLYGIAAHLAMYIFTILFVIIFGLFGITFSGPSILFIPLIPIGVRVLLGLVADWLYRRHLMSKGATYGASFPRIIIPYFISLVVQYLFYGLFVPLLSAFI